MTEDEMIGWHPQLNGHEFEQALRPLSTQWKPAVSSHQQPKEGRILTLV